ncbi:hypothetical protein EMIHUDRAFT_205390 [Emiliania huxleyi CCMP1516]|uniref:Major facilitator superfamily (MFS) profile domain-containing protein n=2 Tax=Emiliania huxleyi TaxID=2903 RepID=A0A0D3JS96_EMIH1|nr:hypothetical protein EMIHUDRAFT_205390 [Emiliania huxleyi CCMP1516]EOD26381.1 hypothetical protein EMIHUDRAFT_205390 [Emiliania huxleyi CCMP1516]|eukprot:XP_005778810.1 hypothetical protein EMIHUDRAFT_205390 [Emiliania huxleyi CCMP1516]
MLNAEWPWHRFGVTGVYSSVLMMTGLSINVLGPVGPVLMRHLSASPHSIGSIYSAEGLGNFLGSLLLGPVLSRLRPHAVLVGVSALVFLCLGAVPSCSALHQVASLYLLIGLASGLGNATANTSLTWAWHGAAPQLAAAFNLAAYLSSLYWSAFVVGRLSATPLAAYFSPGSILVPSLALEARRTVGAGVGVSMLFSNILSLLARYGLLTTAMTGALGAFAAIGHMTVPSLAGAAIDRHGYAALMPLLCALNGVGLALLTAARRIASEWSPSPRGNSALDGGSSSGEDWAEAGQGERQRLLGGASRRGSAPTTGTVVV